MVDTCICTVQVHVWWGKKGRNGEKEEEKSAPFYEIGFKMKSIRLRGVRTATSDVMFMLWKPGSQSAVNWLSQGGKDNMTLQQFMFHLIQSNEYLITLNSISTCQLHDLWQWTRLNDYLAEFSTCWNSTLLSVLFLAVSWREVMIL